LLWSTSASFPAILALVLSFLDRFQLFFELLELLPHSCRDRMGRPASLELSDLLLEVARSVLVQRNRLLSRHLSDIYPLAAETMRLSL